MTSTAIAPYQPANLDEIQRTAKLLMASGYFDAKGAAEMQIAQLATKIIAGAELGYAPFTAVQGIHVIQGKPSIGANLMAAAVKAHPSYDYRVRRMDNDGVELEFLQMVGGTWESLGVESFTMDDAKAAGLLGKDNWKKFPRNMLFARCISNGVRFRCPDVFNGNSVYVPEELGANVDGDGNVIDAGYTVHKPQPVQAQNGNGHHAEDASYADAFVVVDMADIPEDTAGAMATPQRSNGKPAPKAKAPAAQNGNTDHAGLVKQANALGEAAWGDWDAKRVQLFEANGVDSTDSLSDDTLAKLIGKASQVLRDEMAAALEGYDPAGQVELMRQATVNKDGKFAVDHVNMLKDGWNVYFAHKKLNELLAA